MQTRTTCSAWCDARSSPSKDLPQHRRQARTFRPNRKVLRLPHPIPPQAGCPLPSRPISGAAEVAALRRLSSGSKRDAFCMKRLKSRSGAVPDHPSPRPEALPQGAAYQRLPRTLMRPVTGNRRGKTRRLAIHPPRPDRGVAQRGNRRRKTSESRAPLGNALCYTSGLRGAARTAVSGGHAW